MSNELEEQVERIFYKLLMDRQSKIYQAEHKKYVENSLNWLEIQRNMRHDSAMVERTGKIDIG